VLLRCVFECYAVMCSSAHGRLFCVLDTGMAFGMRYLWAGYGVFEVCLLGVFESDFLHTNTCNGQDAGRLRLVMVLSMVLVEAVTGVFEVCFG